LFVFTVKDLVLLYTAVITPMMTKPELKEKLIRSPTSLPPRISSYYGPIIAGDNIGNNNNKWNEFICKFIHALSTIIQFCSPLVITVAWLSYDSVIFSAVAFGLLLLKILVLDFHLFKMGKIQNWPNKVSRKINVLSVQIILIQYSTTEPFKTMGGIDCMIFEK
jgi:hypothetical protein